MAYYDDLPDWACTPWQLKQKIKKRFREPYGTYEHELPILEQIMEMHRKGFPPTFIAGELNSHRVQARTRQWYETTIRRIIKRVSATAAK